MKIIGLAGKKCSGKDTIADIIRERSGIKIGFADALYEEVAILLLRGVDSAKFPNSLKIKKKIDFIKENKNSFRTLLQWWGTDYRRKFFGEDYWTKEFLHRINAVPSETQYLLVPDVRFENELQCLRSLGAEVWMVRRNKCDISDVHQSENDLIKRSFKFERTIYNDYTLAKLKQTVLQYI